MRISIKTYRKNEDLQDENSWSDFLNSLMTDSECPAPVSRCDSVSVVRDRMEAKNEGRGVCWTR